jgi:hypothetical protein
MSTVTEFTAKILKRFKAHLVSAAGLWRFDGIVQSARRDWQSPHELAFISGIGCSSHTRVFYGLRIQRDRRRALPISLGVKLRTRISGN